MSFSAINTAYQLIKTYDLEGMGYPLPMKNVCRAIPAIRNGKQYQIKECPALINPLSLSVQWNSEGYFLIQSNYEDRTERQQLAKAVGLGHVVLGHIRESSTEVIEASSFVLDECNTRARDAIYFALALLMPEKELRSVISSAKDINQLASYFGVPFAAVSFWLDYTGILKK